MYLKAWEIGAGLGMFCLLGQSAVHSCIVNWVGNLVFKSLHFVFLILLFEGFCFKPDLAAPIPFTLQPHGSVGLVVQDGDRPILLVNKKKKE